MKTKIVYVIGQLGIGGSEKYLCDLVRYLDKNSFSVSIICLTDNTELANNMLNDECIIYTMNFTFMKKPRTILKLAYLIKTLNPDIVHTIGRARYYSIPACYLAKIDKTVISIRSIYKQLLVEKWYHRFIDKFIFKKVKLALFNSHEGRKSTWTDLRLTVAKTAVIYNGINLKSFDQNQNSGLLSNLDKSLNPTNNSPIICIVANLTQKKLIDQSIQAHKLLINKYPKSQLWIIGKGELESELKHLAKELELVNSVHFLGSRKDVPAILKMVDIAILTSISEGLSNALIEYMASRLPVVATNVGGNPELILNGITGILVPVNSPVHIFQAISRLIENKNLMAKMGDNARQLIETKFSMQTMISETEKQYHILMDK